MPCTNINNGNGLIRTGFYYCFWAKLLITIPNKRYRMSYASITHEDAPIIPCRA